MMNADTGTTVSSIMQRDVLSVGDSWPLHQLASFLTDNQISGAPVTSEDGELIGVVSLTDIVRYDSMPENRAELHDRMSTIFTPWKCRLLRKKPLAFMWSRNHRLL